MYSNSPIKRFAIINPLIICICLNCNMQMRFWHPQVWAGDEAKCSKKVRQMNVELDFLLAGILHIYDCMQTSLYRLYRLFCNSIRCWLVTHLLFQHFLGSICITALTQLHVTNSAWYALFTGENPT